MQVAGNIRSIQDAILKGDWVPSVTNRELIVDFVKTGSQSSFTEIVRRHTPMILAACVRVLKDRQLAEDATQAAFLVLSRKAATTSWEKTNLSGWLYLTAQNCAKSLKRTVARRSRHERAVSDAVEVRTSVLPESSPSDVAAELDGVLTLLSPLQRDALVMRYLNGLSEAESARELNCTQVAVNSRVKHALSTLRQKLAHRGVSVSASALCTLIVKQSVFAVPATLTNKITSICLGHAAASELSAETAQSVIKNLLIKKIAAIAAVILVVTVLAVPAASIMMSPVGPSSVPQIAPLFATSNIVLAGYYASPYGKPDADGSITRPWDLKTALSATSIVKPGETLWLRGGHYGGGFTVKLAGTAQQPVTIRNYPNERVLLDGFSQSMFYGRTTVFVLGGFVNIHGIEITCATYPADAQDGAVMGITVVGKNTRLQNLVLHHLSYGVSIHAACDVADCVFYNIGIEVADQSWGCAIIHNRCSEGGVRIRNNIVFDSHAINFLFGGPEETIEIEGNAFFASAGHKGSATQANVHVNRSGAYKRFVFKDNVISSPDNASSFILEQPDSPMPGVAALTGNRFIGGTPTVYIQRNTSGETAQDGNFNVLFRNNIISGAAKQPLIVTPESRVTASWNWNENKYICGTGAEVFQQADTRMNFSAWQTQSRFDNASQTVAPSRQTVEVIASASAGVGGRGYLMIKNWNGVSSAQVDLSFVLRLGERYEIREALNILERPLLIGVFDGNPVTLPLVTDSDNTQLRKSEGDFKVFVIQSATPRIPSNERLNNVIQH
jgi:RNA polymerase sigma factor (sigma-70 family)